MSWPETIRKIDKRLLLAVISVFIGVAGLYAVFHEEKSGVSMNIINETDVLDVRKPLEELSISFKGEDIQKENLNLRIITLKVENDGGLDILQSHFDKDSIWGVRVENGDIIEARLTNASSDYISSNLKPEIIEDISAIEFNKIIFEKDENFTVEILVLHSKVAEPKIIPMGKIAGIGEVQVTRSETGVEESFVERVFFGNAWVQISRLVAYVIAGIVILVIVLLITFGISGAKKKRKKKARANKVKLFFHEYEGVEVENLKIVKVIEDIYRDGGSGALLAARDILKRPSVYKEEIEEETRRKRYLGRMGGEPSEQFIEAVEASGEEGFIRELMINRLVKRGIVRIDKDKKVVVESGFKKTLNKLIEYLDIEKREEET